MMLGTYTLASATIGSIGHTTKQAVHVYDWSDECAVTDMGHGPTTFTVSGVAADETERNNVTAATEAARTAETNLYFASAIGASDDHYYRVHTGPAVLEPVTATLYRYQFSCIAVVPWVYDAATGERVT